MGSKRRRRSSARVEGRLTKNLKSTFEADGAKAKRRFRRHIICKFPEVS
jgi:hypothetical protein